MADKCIKMCSTALVIRQMQTEAITRDRRTRSRTTKPRVTAPSVGGGVEQPEPTRCPWACKAAAWGQALAVSHETEHTPTLWPDDSTSWYCRERNGSVCPFKQTNKQTKDLSLKLRAALFLRFPNGNSQAPGSRAANKPQGARVRNTARQ